MTNLLSGRHKYLTNKNTKKGQKVRKISALSALKNGYCAFAAGESRGSCVAVRQGRCRKICGLWENKSKAYKRKTAFYGNSCLNTQILRIFQAARRKILLQYICKSSSEERILNYEAEKNTLLGIDCGSYLLRVVVRLFDRPRRNYERRSNLHFRKRRSGNERQ